MHPIKVRTKAGRIYYISEGELQKRASRAEKKPADLIVPESIKEQAEKMAEQKMEVLQKVEEQKAEAKPDLPEFQGIAKSFMRSER